MTKQSIPTPRARQALSRTPASRLERWLPVLAALALVYPRAAFDYIGIVLIAIVLVSQKLRRADAHASSSG